MFDFSFALNWENAEIEGKKRFEKFADYGTNPIIGTRGQVAGVAGEMAFSAAFLLEREAEIVEAGRGDKGRDFQIATGETVDIKAREIEGEEDDSAGRLAIQKGRDFGVFKNHCTADIIVFAWRPGGTNQIILFGWLPNSEVQRYPLRQWTKGVAPSYTIPTQQVRPMSTLLIRHLQAPSGFRRRLTMRSALLGEVVEFQTTSKPGSAWACVDGVIMTTTHIDHMGRMSPKERRNYFPCLRVRAAERGAISTFSECKIKKLSGFT